MTVKKVITSIIIFSVFGVFGQTKLIDDRFAFTPGLDFDENIDSPETYLGYELGSEYTLYANVVSYLKYLSSNSDKIIMNSYGKTYEGRSLEYLIISSKTLWPLGKVLQFSPASVHVFSKTHLIDSSSSIIQTVPFTSNLFLITCLINR